MSQPIIELDEYQWYAIRTCPATRTRNDLITNLCMGLAGEAGETVDYMKKVVFHGHSIDPDTLVKELGDVLWYLAVLADVHGISLSQIATKNIEKLKARYPAGFSEQDSINRKD